ncbi:mmf1 [Trichoderma harzianum]|uniref:Mmf1 n=1 Tax=Trichoderma harzianum TaxID=5544 RepID=A0A0F9XB12_TRIHA|nr:mmf1 [Trichoderma harzianum]
MVPWFKGRCASHNNPSLTSKIRANTSNGLQIQDRTRQVIKNLEAVLAAEEMSLKNVVKATIYIKNFDENFPLVNQVWEEMMPEPRPTRTSLGVAQLPAGGTDVEIEFVAYKA